MTPTFSAFANIRGKTACVYSEWPATCSSVSIELGKLDLGLREMARGDGEKILQISDKFQALFRQAEVIYCNTTINCEQTITALSEALHLSPAYLSDRRNRDRLRVEVERAVLLRYGIGPVQELKSIIEDPIEGPAASIVREQRAAAAWREFHARWPHWRTGTGEEFALALARLGPAGGLLDEEPLRTARLIVAKHISSRRFTTSSSIDEVRERVRPVTEGPLQVPPATHSPPMPHAQRMLLLNLPTLTRAFHYASTVSTIVRASGAPTISHLQQVVGIVLENGGSQDEGAAAFLHDIAEDYGVEKLAEIEDLFGANVASMVRECSDSFKVEGQHRRPWFPRKHEFLKALPRKSVSALRIMVADKLHNARSMLRDGRIEGGQLWTKLKRSPEETTAYFTVAQRIFAARLPSAPTTELGLVVAMLETSFCSASLIGEKITAFSRDVTW